MNNDNLITVIGGGLAGCEAAWQAAKFGCRVRLIEMKPLKFTPAHHSPLLGELVCSNSLRAAALTNAVGLLKEELRRCSSLIMEAADACAVPAGGALAVDRTKFSEYITEKIRICENIELIEDEITEVPNDGITVIATGPLTTDELSASIADKIGAERLSFFDAAAPIVDASTLDMDKVYAASRYGKGEAAYLNCPMNEEEYAAFYAELIGAKTAKVHDFDECGNVFEGCMPIEVMASRGVDTMRFGPLKPVGLPDPKTGRDPYAVVQLRAENVEGTMYNLVGFQTHLTFPEQKRVFSMIPGLESADFLRYGVMHRNTYLRSPDLLSADYSLRTRDELFFAGQMTGVEGYVESTASGLVAGINAARRASGSGAAIFPADTAIGALAAYVSNPAVAVFQPMNINFGLIPALGFKVKGGKAAKNTALSERALESLGEFLKGIELV